jgi:hypothetical protein
VVLFYRFVIDTLIALRSSSPVAVLFRASEQLAH